MAERRLGIFLGRASAEASLLQARWRQSAKIIARSAVTSEASLWRPDHSGLASLFRQLARKLPSEARRADVEHRISLPDPLVNEDRLDFQDLPKDPEEARALILWRVAREHRKPPESLACAWQVEKEQDGLVEVLVRLLDRALLDAVTDAAGTVGIFPTRVDGWSGFALSRPGVTESGSGARLWANDDWWSLMCWARREDAGQGGETLVHSEWREGDAPAKTMAEKVVRLARSFALSSGAERLPLDLDMPEDLADRLRATLGEYDALLPSPGTEFIRLGGADSVALDAA